MGREDGADLVRKMTLSSDETHFSNIDAQKELFVKQWIQWVLTVAKDKTFGMTMEDVPAIVRNQGFPGRPARSRSPRRQQQTQQFNAPWNGFFPQQLQQQFQQQFQQQPQQP